MKHRLLLIAVASLGLLQGCAGVFIAGAATTASVANDRRTVGSVLDDQNIELKAANAIASRKDMDKASRISATSVNGKVLLVGQTPTANTVAMPKSWWPKLAGFARFTTSYGSANP